MSKGGSQKTEVQIPEWLETAAQGALKRADQTSQLGYMPYYGPDVAAMNGMQQAAMQGTNQAARAFGMKTSAPMAGMPKPQTFEGGVQGYSSGGLFDQARDEMARRNPGQARAYNRLFVDPQTGARR